MTLRTIVTLPDPVLRRKARNVTVFDKKLQTLIDDMIETMRDAPGVGLAEEVEDETKKKVWALINPEIVKASEEKVMGVEGCLSIPNLVGEVERHEAIQIKAFNRHGQPMKLKVSGWLARIFQHEVDHLNGVVFTDLATRVWIPETEEEKEDRV